MVLFLLHPFPRGSLLPPALIDTRFPRGWQQIDKNFSFFFCHLPLPCEELGSQKAVEGFRQGRDLIPLQPKAPTEVGAFMCS